MSKAIYDDVMGDRDDKPRVTDSLAPDYEQSEAPSVDEILDSLNNELVINKNDGFISVDALEQAKAKINRLIVGARLDEHKFWDGFFENEEVDKEELIFHRNIRKEQLSNNLSKGKDNG